MGEYIQPQVTGGEITAGTATGLRKYSPADIKSFVTQHAPSPSYASDIDDFLAAANDAAARTELGAASLAGDTFTGPLYQTAGQPIGWTDARLQRVGAGSVGVYQSDGSTLGTLQAATVDNPSAALTLGNATHGVTVPGDATFKNDALKTFSDTSSYGSVSCKATENNSNYVLTIRDLAGDVKFYVSGNGGVGYFQDQQFGSHNIILGDGQGIRINENGLNSASLGTIGWSSTSHAYDAIDSKIGRDASGPSHKTMADGGLKVRNLADSADAPITAGAATFSDQVVGKYRSLSADPTTLDIASGYEGIFENTTAGTVARWVNHAGTMKSVAYT